MSEELLLNVGSWRAPLIRVKELTKNNIGNRRTQCRDFCRDTTNCKSGWVHGSNDTLCGLYSSWDYVEGNVRTNGEGRLYTIGSFTEHDNTASSNVNNIISAVDPSNLPYGDTNKERCRMTCNLNPACVGTTLKDKMCTLYNRVDEEDKVEDRDSILYINDRPPAWKTSYTINNNRDAPGNEIENKGKIEVQKCEDYCQENTDCKGYTIDNGDCILKDSWYNIKQVDGKTMYINTRTGGNLKQNSGDSYMSAPDIQECNISISEDEDDELTELRACRDAANCYSTNILNNQAVLNYNNHLTSLYSASYQEWEKRNAEIAQEVSEWEAKRLEYETELQAETRGGSCWGAHDSSCSCPAGWTRMKETRRCKRNSSTLQLELNEWELANPKPSSNEVIPDIKYYNLLATNDSAGIVQCCANTVGVYGNATDITQTCIQEVENNITIIEEERKESDTTTVPTTVPTTVSNTTVPTTVSNITVPTTVSNITVPTTVSNTTSSTTNAPNTDSSEIDNSIYYIVGILAFAFFAFFAFLSFISIRNI